MMDSRIDKHGELHTVPAIAWIASFTLCVLGDVMLGRWVCYRSTSPDSTAAR
jgi:hypothetical protein